MGSTTLRFELVRVIPAPIDEVFGRLIDFAGYAEWMPVKGSILRRTEQTSPGEPALGTTFLDQTTTGPTPGEIVEFDPPTRVVFHWWDPGRSGRISIEGWPGYALGAVDASTTLVRHFAALRAHGVSRIGMPLWRRIALRERRTTVDALQASFARAA
ncbi:SRPBCC family protein [Agromyces sp. GXS1127]|uniref:SRPBCC family protein n=1 Tax=Agromyces sp. GXS1127 TaxID=3424181 RepID=UPI003D317E7A